MRVLFLVLVVELGVLGYGVELASLIEGLWHVSLPESESD